MKGGSSVRQVVPPDRHEVVGGGGGGRGRGDGQDGVPLYVY